MAKGRLFTYDEVKEAVDAAKGMFNPDTSNARTILNQFGGYALRHLIETPPKTDSSDAVDIVIQNSSNIFEMGPAESVSGEANCSRVVIVARNGNEKEVFKGVNFSESALEKRFKEKRTTSQLSG